MFNTSSSGLQVTSASKHCHIGQNANIYVTKGGYLFQGVMFEGNKSLTVWNKFKTCLINETI